MGGKANANGGPGNDAIAQVVIEQPGGKGGARVGGHAHRHNGGGGTALGALLATETVVRIRTEGSADFLAGFAEGMAARNAIPANILQEAADWWGRAHPTKTGEAAQARRDEKQYQLGYDLGNSEAFGFVLLHLGWTPALWASVMPRELAAGQAAQGPIFEPDDGTDIAVGAAGGGIGGVLGGAAGTALGALFPELGGPLVGGALGTALGGALGGLGGVGASNEAQQLFSPAPQIGQPAQPQFIF